MLELSDDVISVQQGSLYPRAPSAGAAGLDQGHMERTPPLGGAAKFYALTREGRQQLERELDSWKRLSSAVKLLLRDA
jgi:DNA-binding PadR family transcriptional regulator